jgi:hypothetical protein
MGDRDLKDVVADLDAVATWFAPGSARHAKIKGLADELAAQAGGRKEVVADPSQPTPGPGVRTQPQPVEVESVGAISSKPTTRGGSSLGQVTSNPTT